MRHRCWGMLSLLLPAIAQVQQPSSTPLFQLIEVMVPVRDGVRLQTVILAPAGQTAPLPILFRRTPYGVPDKPPEEMPPSMKELAQDGYIFVIQNLRGRFKSEGVFTLSSHVREYVSDPANPVPYRQRPISPTYPAGDWRTWEVADQRFVDRRPDVLTFVSAPLEHDLTVTGELAADLFASTSGTDADFIVKLIDVYPEDAQQNAWDPEAGPKPGQYARSVNGYELPIAMEVRRGRYNSSYEHPRALVPNAPVEWRIPLRDHDHVFLKGHRLMVQVQSTWFPLIDRNPQTFVPSIYRASAADFTRATQRVYCSPARPSHIVLPVVP
jgi:predicted acyl esterase